MDKRLSKGNSKRSVDNSSYSGVLRQFTPAISDDWLSPDPRDNYRPPTSSNRRLVTSGNVLKDARPSSSPASPYTTSRAASRGTSSHSGRRFSCPECLVSCDGPAGLEDHMRRKHDEAVPGSVSCPHCNEGIKHRTNLHRHIRVKHDERTGRQHCRKCGFACSSEADLNKHKEKHRTCPFCHILMESGTGLAKHMRNCRLRHSSRK